jgi:hypothetical protein
MDNGTTSLDDLLNGTEPTEAPAEAVQEAPTEAPEPETIGPARDEHGRFAPKEATGVETPAPEPDAVVPTATEHPLPQAEYKALKEEKRRRQEAEARITALEAQYAQQAAQAKPPEPETDFWENPQGAIATQVQRAVLDALQAEKQQQTLERINESEAKARETHDDYGDAFLAFQQAATANPSLIQQMTAASDPAEFAYKKGKTALELERVGSIDELLKAERAKWEAEARAAMPAPPALPSTTATDGSVGGRAGPAWAGPPSLDDLLR